MALFDCQPLPASKKRRKFLSKSCELMYQGKSSSVSHLIPACLRLWKEVFREKLRYSYLNINSLIVVQKVIWLSTSRWLVPLEMLQGIWVVCIGLIIPVKDPGLSEAAGGNHAGYVRLTQIIPDVESSLFCLFRTPLNRSHSCLGLY